MQEWVASVFAHHRFWRGNTPVQTTFLSR